MEIVKVNSIYQECSEWDSLVVVTEWSNTFGVDIQITSKNGGIQHISVTYDEFELIKNAIAKLDKNEN